MSENQQQRTMIVTQAKLVSFDLPGEGKKFGSGAFKITGDLPEGMGRGGTKILVDIETWPNIAQDAVDEVTADISFEKVASKDGKSHSYFLQSWNGVSKPAYEGKKSGGASGGQYKPKTFEEIHSSSVAGIIKSVLENIDLPSCREDRVESWIRISVNEYFEGIKRGKVDLGG